MSYHEVKEYLRDPPVEAECASTEHFLWNVRRWAMRLALAADSGTTSEEMEADFHAIAGGPDPSEREPQQ